MRGREREREGGREGGRGREREGGRVKKEKGHIYMYMNVYEHDSV